MKRNQLETIVLIAGIAVIGIGLFFMLSGANNPFISNMIFPFGFLVYIIYSIMNTSSLQKEIRSLNSHIEALKDEIKRKDASLKEKETSIKELETKQQEMGLLLTEKEAVIKEQAEEVADLKSKVNKESDS